MTRIGDEKAGGEIVRAVGDNVILRNQRGGVFGRRRNDAHENAAWLENSPRSVLRLAAHGVQHHVHVAHVGLERRRRVVHYLVRAEFAHEIDVARRGRPDDERALAVAFPALTSYFSVVQETKGLEGIMLKVVDTPSLWSIIKKRGVRVGIGFDSEADEMVHRRHRGVEFLKMRRQRVLGINVKRRAEFARERLDGDAFAKQPAAGIMKIVHDA